jgi:hypothetical protein
MTGLRSFGRRPMFDTGAVLLEIFPVRFLRRPLCAALDCAFIGWIRPEMNFDSVEDTGPPHGPGSSQRPARAGAARTPFRRSAMPG